MRILLLTDKPPWPADSGGAFATQGLIKGLALTGCKITIVTLYSQKHPYNYDIGSTIPGVECVIPVYADTAVKPGKLLFNLFFSQKPYSIERFRTEDFEKRIYALKDTVFDFAIFEGLKTTIYFDIIRKLKVRRLIYRPHNVESHIWKKLATVEKSPVRRAYFNSLSERIHKTETEILSRADGIAAMTGNDLNWFNSHGAAKPSTVINPGIQILPLPDRNRELEGSVAWIGSLDWEPNIIGLEWFIKNIWPAVSEQNPASLFHIAGRNPEKSLYRRLQGKNIHFSGPVLSSAGFLTDKSVIVSPLFAGSGIRIKILEAMSLGKAVVATSEAAEGLICNPGENIIIANEPARFAGKIKELLNDAMMRKSIGDKARENVRKNYDIFKAAEKLLEFDSGLPDAD